VRLDVEIGPGAVLELADIAATVAYHGRGRSASWHTSLRLGLGAVLHYAGLPLVVSEGAEVTRTLTVDLADGARARVRETVVLGRAGEVGGRLEADTVVRRSGDELLRETLLLDPVTRHRPGVLGGVRVLDSILELGSPPSAGPESDPPTPWRTIPDGDRLDVACYVLLDQQSTLTRFLGRSLADSPLR
jgi:urease accessory protein